MVSKQGIYLGTELVGGIPKLRSYNGDGHLLTIGPTRSGKSRRLLIPNLLYETGRSMLVVDMKGELAAHTASYRAARGNRVVALDPFGVLPKRGMEAMPSVGFNPMLRLEPTSDEFVDDAMALAEALVPVNPGDKDPHWPESAQDLVAGLIMLARSRGVRSNLNDVRVMLCVSPKEMECIAAQVFKDERMHHAIRNKLSKYNNPGTGEEIASIMSNAQTQTRFLDSPAIAKNLEADDIDFGRLKTEKLTVYLVLPPERLVTHAKWLRLIITSAMTAMQQTEKPDRPEVLFMLDEFPQLGRMESIESAVSLNAGYGVKIWAAVQHLGQLKTNYGENWETFISAGCVTSFAPRDLFTRDYLTKLIGQRAKMTSSRSADSDGGTSISIGEEKDDLVSPDDWRAMILGDQYAFIPTKNKGQFIKRISGQDFTKLPRDIDGTYLLPGKE